MPDNNGSSPAGSSRDRVVEYLATRGGRIESADGRGITADMAKTVGYSDVTALNAMLSRLEREGIIAREVRGKRTFAISLTGKGSRTSAGGGRRTAKAASGPGRATRAGAAKRATATKSVSKAAPRVSKAAAAPTPAKATRRTPTVRAAAPRAGLAEMLGAVGAELEALRAANEALTARVAQLEQGTGSATAARSRAGARRGTARRGTARKGR